VIRDIRDAREKYRADIVIPFLHWGWEDESMPSERQRVFAALRQRAAPELAARFGG